MANDIFYKSCSRAGLHGHTCAGKITWEHAMIYAGSQIQELWAIIPLCAKGHSVNEWQDGGDLNKRVNEWIALNRASSEELLAISRATDYFKRRNFLNKIYGVYAVEKPGINCGQDVEINYDILNGGREFGELSPRYA